MNRKLVKQGDNALTVTLPAQWTKKFGLKSGDTVDLREQEADILVSTSKDTETKTVSLNVAGCIPMVRRILSSAYKSGYDEFEILYEKPDELEAIQFAVDQEFIGFEIVEQGKNRILAKRISNIEHSEFDPMLRRTFLFLMQMAEDSLDSVEKGHYDELQNIALRDHNINRFTDFCRRALNKKAAVKFKRVSPLYYIVEEIEKVGDCYRDICKDLAKDKTKLRKETLEIYMTINKFLRLFYESFYAFDLKNITEIGKQRKEIQKQFEELFKKPAKDETKTLFNLFNAFNMIFDMNGPLMATNL